MIPNYNSKMSRNELREYKKVHGMSVTPSRESNDGSESSSSKKKESSEDNDSSSGSDSRNNSSGEEDEGAAADGKDFETESEEEVNWRAAAVQAIIASYDSFYSYSQINKLT